MQTIEGPIAWMSAFREMVDAREHNISVWSDCVNHGHDDKPQPIGHFISQLQKEAPIVDGFTTFEVSGLRHLVPNHMV